MDSNDSTPPVWFRLPPGFHSFQNVSQEALTRIVSECVLPLLEGTPEADSLLGDTQVLAGAVDTLLGKGCAYLALGLHPDDAEGACASLFSLSTIRTAGPSPTVAAARAGITLAKSPLWEAKRSTTLALPTGVSAAMVAGIFTPPLTEAQSTRPSPASTKVFQARLAMPYPCGSHVIVADLTSAATHYADAYTDILEAVAHTFSFTAPAPVSEFTGTAPTSRILEFLT
ncbi:hypothetical protein [Streptomyces sp. NPDC006368]|uniref:hypothetical protein n=1 Tax=Streptomyces sp. NPDC006368 TaxID=3156760 RepID=UPI0033A1CCE6